MAGKAAEEFKANTAYYDSGANKHFFKYKPDQYQPYAKPTFVMNANGAKDPILGSGTISLGKLKLKDVQYVPNFVENLVSGVELMKKGYKTILESDKIVITKQGEEIASGNLCMNTDMILIQKEAESGIDLCNSAVKGSDKGKCIRNLHEILGHCAKDTVRLTFDLSDQSSGELDCSICASTKTKQRNIPKIASNPPSVKND